MISKLNGIVDSAGSDWAVIDVGGVGYQVFCSARTLAALPSAGEAASVFTEMLVSETSIRLVGFSSAVERDWFRLLDQVQGVGTKVALSVLSTLSTSELASAIALKDLATVARAPGVGKKVAERICTELRDKGPEMAGADLAVAGLSGPARAFEGPAADAVSALVNLGYAQVRAAAAVAAAGRANGANQSAEELIRRGLKELAR